MAIPLVSEIANYLWQTLQPLQKQLDWKWVQPENMHLTVRFFGEIDETSCKELSQNVQANLTTFKPFTIRWSGLGTFPKHGSVKVLWCGMDKGIQSWKELCIRVDNPSPLAELQPHATLARNRTNTRPEVIDRWLEEHRQTVWGDQVVQSVTLFRSLLRPQGPIYTPIETFHLGSSVDD